jgi:hypothetical protein
MKIYGNLMARIKFKPVWIVLGLPLLVLLPFLAFHLVSNVYQLMYHKSFLSVLAPLALPNKNCDLQDIYTSIFDEDMGKIHDFHGTVPIDGPRVQTIHEYIFKFVCCDNLQPGSGIKTYKNLKDYYKHIHPEVIPSEILAHFPELTAQARGTKCWFSPPGRYDCWFSQSAGPGDICGYWIIRDLATHTYYVVDRYDPYS